MGTAEGLHASEQHATPPIDASSADNAAAIPAAPASSAPGSFATEAAPATAAAAEAAVTGAVVAPNTAPGLPPRSKGGAGRGGARRGRPPKGGSLPVEQVVLPASVETVRIKYEPKSTEPTDDLSVVTMSQVNKASQMLLSDDRLTVTGHKGFRSARSSHGVFTGTWYCEAKVEHLGATGHVRVGWGTKRAELQAPVGFDTFGFGFRDVDGSKVHDGKRQPYGTGFREGDVIGLLIHLPEAGRSLELETKQYARYKGRWMRVEEEEPKPQRLPGSVIAFTLNGVLQRSPSLPAASAVSSDAANGTAPPSSADPTISNQQQQQPDLPGIAGAQSAPDGVAPGSAATGTSAGVPGAFTDFNDGTYFPIASLYTMPEQAEGASVRMNFGPTFAFTPPPPGAIAAIMAPARALCERAADMAAAAAAAAGAPAAAAGGKAVVGTAAATVGASVAGTAIA